MAAHVIDHPVNREERQLVLAHRSQNVALDADRVASRALHYLDGSASGLDQCLCGLEGDPLHLLPGAVRDCAKGFCDICPETKRGHPCDRGGLNFLFQRAGQNDVPYKR